MAEVPVNDYRGEIAAEVFGETRTLKLDLNSIREMEIAADLGWQEIISRAIDGVLRIDDIAAIYWAGLRGGGMKDPPSLEEVSEWVFQQGLLRTNPGARDLMLLQAVGAERADDISKKLVGLVAGNRKGRRTKTARARKTTNGKEASTG